MQNIRQASQIKSKIPCKFGTSCKFMKMGKCWFQHKQLSKIYPSKITKVDTTKNSISNENLKKLENEVKRLTKLREKDRSELNDLKLVIQELCQLSCISTTFSVSTCLMLLQDQRPKDALVKIKKDFDIKAPINKALSVASTDTMLEMGFDIKNIERFLNMNKLKDNLPNSQQIQNSEQSDQLQRKFNQLVLNKILDLCILIDD